MLPTRDLVFDHGLYLHACFYVCVEFGDILKLSTFKVNVMNVAV